MNKKIKKVPNPIWGGRFNDGANDLAKEFTSSINNDHRLYKEDIKSSMAHALALKEANLINRKDYSKITKGLKLILNEIKSGKFKWHKELEDIHMNIEFALEKKAGTSSKRLHTGRSRNDQIATDLKLYLMKSIEEILSLITKTQISIVKKALRHHSTLMPGFTHLQMAQPITFGHHLMAWFEMLNRDFSRFQESKKRMSSLPLGSGALSGIRYNLDRNKLAKRLNFNKVTNNSIDAVSDRDFAVEFLSCTCLLEVHLSRMNEEIIIWSSNQFHYIELPDEFCTGSSIMPQKKNPDVAELLRGGSSKSIANLVGILTLIKNQPLAYNRDMQEDKGFIFDSLDYCMVSLKIFSSLVEGMKANIKKMEQDCNLGQLTATELADYLVLKNVPFRNAHHITGKIVAYAEKKELQIFELSLDELKKFSKVIDKDVKRFLVPSEAIKSKKIRGGTAPNQVLYQAKKAMETLQKRKK